MNSHSSMARIYPRPSLCSGMTDVSRMRQFTPKYILRNPVADFFPAYSAEINHGHCFIGDLPRVCEEANQQKIKSFSSEITRIAHSVIDGMEAVPKLIAHLCGSVPDRAPQSAILFTSVQLL